MKKGIRCTAGDLGCRLLVTVAVVVQGGVAHAQTISPTRVVNLRSVAPVDLSTWRVVDATQSNGYWAVLLRGGPGLSRTAVVSGDSREQRASFPIGVFDRVIMDRDHVIHLRHESSRRDATEISTWKPASEEIETRIVAGPWAEPIQSDGVVEWKPARGRVAPVENRQQGAAAIPTPGVEQELAIPERKFVLGLPARRYLVFGSRTEEVVVHDPSGAVLSRARADLDSAYPTIGLQVPKPDLGSGRSRVVWAATSREGLLYVHLSETSIARPTPIAVFEPTDGRFIRMVNAVHPTPEGSVGENEIAPGRGAIDDQLIVVYTKGYIALY